MEKRCLYEFGRFVLDPLRRVLVQNGSSVSIGPKAFDILLALVERSGNDLGRKELLRLVWGNTAVEDRTLNVHIAALRKSLGETANAHNYILTLPGRGYRFIGRVRQLPEEQPVEVIRTSHSTAHVVFEEEIEELEEEGCSPEVSARTDAPPSRGVAESVGPATARARDRTALGSRLLSLARALFFSGLFRRVAPLAAIVGALILGLRWFSKPEVDPESAISIRELTTNSAEAAVNDAAISPDGGYLAYVDEAGTHLQVVETGELHPISAPPNCRIVHVAWFPDSTIILLSTQVTGGGAAGLWSVSILGGPPHELVEGAGEASVSFDGSHIAFVSANGQEIWLCGPAGEKARRIATAEDDDVFHEVAWARNSQRIFLTKLHTGAYRYDVAIESIDIRTGSMVETLSNPALRGFCVSPPARLIYSEVEPPPNQNTTDLWDIQIDPHTGRTLSKPRRIKRWPGSCLYYLSVSNDGKRLVFLKGTYEADVYVADTRDDGTRLIDTRRLTLDDANDLPTAWTPDSESVLFHSDRNGKWEIFKQGLNERAAQLIATDEADDKGARLSPDGKSILYFSRPKYRMWTWAERSRMITSVLAGGPSRMLMDESGLYSVRCSQSPANLCVLGEQGLTELAFFVLDPLQGKGPELTTTGISLSLDEDNWDLSPDGSKIAIALRGKPDGHIRILSLPDGGTRDLSLSGRGALQSMDWAADGQGMYVSSRTVWGSDLLYVDLQGQATLVRRQNDSFMTWGVPSPDGRHLAFLEWTAAGNVWIMAGF
jgi:DNA-binding winged helix-turn-helix (wHTH) protein/Tol biopolymer transport system component